MKKQSDAHPSWADVTYGDLTSWAGASTLSRGQDCQRRGAVSNVTCSPEGELSGGVAGGSLYRVRVTRRAGGRISGTCSCPVGADCKHAVALVLKCLACLKAGEAVPAELPPRHASGASGRSAEDDEPVDDYDDDDDYGDDDEDGADDDDLEDDGFDDDDDDDFEEEDDDGQAGAGAQRGKGAAPCRYARRAAPTRGVPRRDDCPPACATAPRTG